MALDPIILAIRRCLPITSTVLLQAKDHRINRINELWAEIRIVERVLEEVEDRHAALAERDPPIETAEHTRH